MFALGTSSYAVFGFASGANFAFQSRAGWSACPARCTAAEAQNSSDDAPVVVSGDLVLVKQGALASKRVAAVIATHPRRRAATGAPVIRRQGAATDEAFVDFGADEFEIEPENILAILPADVSSRQMTVDNPHGELVE